MPIREKFECGSLRTGLHRILLLTILLAGCAGGCMNQRGDLRFNPIPAGERFTIAGRLQLDVPVETDLLGSIRRDLLIPKKLADFQVSAGDVTTRVDDDGHFVISMLPFSTDLVLNAFSNKVVLQKRIYPRDLLYTDVQQTLIDIDSTTLALIWKKALDNGKTLTEWDILAREYRPALASISQAIRLALQLPAKSVATTILELDMVKRPVAAVAAIIEAREEILREAHSVLENLLYRADVELLKSYLSPQFSNDWDSSSNWQDAVAYIGDLLRRYTVTNASYSILDMEFIPEHEARVRVAAEFQAVGKASAMPTMTKTYVADVFWRKEGTFWKIVRNLPYRETHPTTAGADLRWGQIARAHAELQTALYREELATFQNLISPTFGNDWDLNSTFQDLTETTRQRFNDYDVKIATYTIHEITFRGLDEADVVCSAETLVIRLIPGVDVSTGPISAKVTWKREQGTWKIWRNLPYRFTHPRNKR